jgi:hypothetical protein
MLAAKERPEAPTAIRTDLGAIFVSLAASAPTPYRSTTLANEYLASEERD